MPYRIEENCVGCRVCAQKCPTRAISGEAKQLHGIDPVLCTDCGVCASYCPVEECILDPRGFAAPKIKPNGRPLAVVYPDLCTGCEACVDVCPADCLELVPGEDGAHYAVAQMANAKACTACKECEQICSDKRAIVVEWPDGAYCEFLGEVPENWVAARKGAMASVR